MYYIHTENEESQAALIFPFLLMPGNKIYGSDFGFYIFTLNIITITCCQKPSPIAWSGWEVIYTKQNCSGATIVDTG